MLTFYQKKIKLVRQTKIIFIMIDLERYFMDIAWAVSKKSNDPSTQVGCVIVNKDNKPISFGYNGYLDGYDVSLMRTDYPYKDMMIIHAEMRAMLSSQVTSFENCKVYTTHVSCENCLKHMIHAGIKEFIYEKQDTNANFITPDRKKIITFLVKMTGVVNRNINGKTFIEEMGMEF